MRHAILSLAAVLVGSLAQSQAFPPPAEFAIPSAGVASISDELASWLATEADRLSQILEFLVGSEAMPEYVAWEEGIVADFVGADAQAGLLARMQLRILTIRDLLAQREEP